MARAFSGKRATNGSNVPRRTAGDGWPAAGDGKEAEILVSHLTPRFSTSKVVPAERLAAQGLGGNDGEVKLSAERLSNERRELRAGDYWTREDRCSRASPRVTRDCPVGDRGSRRRERRHYPLFIGSALPGIGDTPGERSSQGWISFLLHPTLFFYTPVVGIDDRLVSSGDRFWDRFSGNRKMFESILVLGFYQDQDTESFASWSDEIPGMGDGRRVEKRNPPNCYAELIH